MFFHQKGKLYREKGNSTPWRGVRNNLTSCCCEVYLVEHLSQDTCCQREGNWVMYRCKIGPFYNAPLCNVKMLLIILKALRVMQEMYFPTLFNPESPTLLSQGCFWVWGTHFGKCSFSPIFSLYQRESWHPERGGDVLMMWWWSWVLEPPSIHSGWDTSLWNTLRWTDNSKHVVLTNSSTSTSVLHRPKVRVPGGITKGRSKVRTQYRNP